MVNYEYPEETYKIGWMPETSYRTTANGKDAANVAGDTCYQFPLEVKHKFEFGMLVEKEAKITAGSLDYGQINQKGYVFPTVTFTGRLHNMDLMNQLMGECTTTDDTPAAGYYTHVYATTTARASVIPSFQIWEKLANPTGANTKYLLHVGCVVVYFSCSCSKDGDVEATIVIEYARTITGAALTTEPSMVWANCYDSDDCVVTYTVGGVTYDVVNYGWTIMLANNIHPQRGQGEDYAERALYGHRVVQIGLDYTPKYETDFTDAETDPGTAKDIDITIKMSRDTTYDYFSVAMEKAWALEYSRGRYNFAVGSAMYLRRKFVYIMNTRETGYKTTLTQVDQKTSTRFT
jgi:hypothetical protein